MKELERLLKGLANKRRLAILKYLKTAREASVKDIADFIKLSFKATSKHLNILSALDILEKDQRSLQIFYSLSANQKPAVKHFLSLL